MPKILAVTDEMMARASSIGNGSSEIRDSQSRVTKIFQEMGRNFSGPIPSLIIEKMIAMEGTYQGMNENLNQYKTFLEDTAKNYEWSDGEASRWMQALNR